MNQIKIEEGIVTNISFSHKINNINYYEMTVITKNSNGKESLIPIKYKEFDNKLYTVGSRVTCWGQLRTYSQKLEDGKNKVSLYVLTNFQEEPSCFDPEVELFSSSVTIDGVICTIQPLRILDSGRCNIHFTLANNITVHDHKYNSYIPCIAWGSLAKFISNLQVGTKLKVVDSELRSREYIKHTDNEDEIHLCHELYLKKVIPEIE